MIHAFPQRLFILAEENIYYLQLHFFFLSSLPRRTLNPYN